MYTPFNYDQINIRAGAYNPSPVKAYNNKTFDFWYRALFQRACSVIEFDLYEDWSAEVRDFFIYSLFRYGYVSIFDSVDYGFTFQPCTLSGLDWYYQPIRALVSNPALNSTLELEIHKDCEILKLTLDYIGIHDIVCYYAEKLSELDMAINMSIINNKIPLIMFGRNKAAAEALKKVIDKVNSGEPAVIVDQVLLNDKTDKDSPFQFWDREHLASNYITTDLLKDFQTLINNFDTEIGIPTIPYEKKERMVQSEAESKELDSSARSTIWLETLTSCFDLINSKYGTNMSATLRYQVDESVDVSEVSEDE